MYFGIGGGGRNDSDDSKFGRFRLNEREGMERGEERLDREL